MASSRKRPRKPDPADRPLLAALARALELAQAGEAEVPDSHAAALAAPLPAPRARMRAARRPSASRSAAPLLLAYSGGPDSTVLVDLACRLRDAGEPGFAKLHAAHVHHGLQAVADDWVEHCERECARRGLALTVLRVQVPIERGLEDGARRARYAALAQEARRLGASWLLTAHNADDRIETFLLQWLRGAGPAGLAGIAEWRELAPEPAPSSEGASGRLHLLRPFLEVSRRQIEEYCERHGLASVQDPSNADPRFARNALRLQVLPALERIRAGYRRSAARSIDLLGEAAEALGELARDGLAACTEGAPAGMLRLDRLAQLSTAHRPLVLRAWLARQGVTAPSRARLREALEQALRAGGEARMLVRLGEQELRRYRGLLCLRPAGRGPHPVRTSEPFYWRGEPEVVVSGWGGVLRFVVDEPSGKSGAPGFDPQWLGERPLEVRARAGGERFKPHALRPSRTLKQLFQEAGVPEFERAELPLLWRDDRLIFVARLGADARFLEPGAGRVRIEWEGEASLLGS